jgi:hypothetical protein
MKAIAAIVLILAASACGGGTCQPDGTNCQLPTCGANQVCARLGSNVCMPGCAADGGGCAISQTCKTVSGCCVGTACAAVLVHVCCAPGQC